MLNWISSWRRERELKKMGKQTFQSPLISFIKKGSMTLLLSTSALLLFSRYFGSDLIFTFESNQENIDMVKGCSLLRKGVYQPTFFMPTAFLQYLFYRHMELEPYIRLDQLKVSDKQTLYSIPVHDGFADNPQTKIVLVVSGCRGIDKAVKQAALAAYRKGYRVVVYELQQFADTAELESVAQALRRAYSSAAIYGVGLEYGANLLVKHAAQTNHYKALVSIGNPLLLETSEKGFRWPWTSTLEKDMIAGRKKKANISLPVKSLYEIDMLQYNLKPEDVPAFKQKNSSINYIKDLKMRSLFLNSQTDPFSMKNMVEDQRIENPLCFFVQTQKGGHAQWFQSSKTRRWGYVMAVQFLQRLDKEELAASKKAQST